MALVTAMTMLAKQFKASRIVAGTKIPHPCGDPNLPDPADRQLRRKIVESALDALRTAVTTPTVFVPAVRYTSG